MAKGFSRSRSWISNEARKSRKRKKKRREEEDPLEWKWSVRYAHYGIYRVSRVPVRRMNTRSRKSSERKRAKDGIPLSVAHENVASCRVVAFESHRKDLCVTFLCPIAPFVWIKSCMRSLHGYITEDF